MLARPLPQGPGPLGAIEHPGIGRSIRGRGREGGRRVHIGDRRPPAQPPQTIGERPNNIPPPLSLIPGPTHQAIIVRVRVRIRQRQGIGGPRAPGASAPGVGPRSGASSSCATSSSNPRRWARRRIGPKARRASLCPSVVKPVRHFSQCKTNNPPPLLGIGWEGKSTPVAPFLGHCSKSRHPPPPTWGSSPGPETSLLPETIAKPSPPAPDDWWKPLERRTSGRGMPKDTGKIPQV